MIKKPTAADLQELKARHGLTGAKLGLMAGVSPRAVRQWLSGDRQIPLSAWRLLCILLDEKTPEQVKLDAET